MNKNLIILSILVFLTIVSIIGILNYLNSSYISIETNPSETTIIINKKEYKSPVKNLKIKAGEYKISVQKENYFEENIDIKIKPKEKKSLNITLKKDISEILPENNDHFKIEIKKEEKVVYEITLYAILNRPDQLDSYNAQLKEYHDEALEWLADKGVNTKLIEIKWDPEEKYIPN